MEPSDRERERDEKEDKDIIVSDMRHSREMDEEEADSAAAEPPPTAKETTASEEEVEPPVEPEPEVKAETPAGVEQEAESPKQPAAPSQEKVEQAEMDQMRQVFAAGVTGYLSGQIGLLLNFALIALGRAPSPATGLISVELEKAKLAIDVLEFIFGKIKDELPAAERENVASLISDLKYAFMQAATGATPAPPAPTPQADS